jgi:hypothetical protein
MIDPFLSNALHVTGGAALATIAVFALRAMLLAIDARLQARCPPQGR